jgi:hypothetical protein
MVQETITLSDELAEFARERIAAGSVKDLSELVSASLYRLMEDRVVELDENDPSVKAFLDAIEEGERDLREGRYISITTKEEEDAFWKSIRDEVRSAP